MDARDERCWNVSNATCDMHIAVGATHMHIKVDAGKYEAYSCRLSEYFEEQAVYPSITYRAMVRNDAGDVVADEVAEEVRLRLNRLNAGETGQQA